MNRQAYFCSNIEQTQILLLLQYHRVTSSRTARKIWKEEKTRTKTDRTKPQPMATERISADENQPANTRALKETSCHKSQFCMQQYDLIGCLYLNIVRANDVGNGAPMRTVWLTIAHRRKDIPYSQLCLNCMSRCVCMSVIQIKISAENVDFRFRSICIRTYSGSILAAAHFDFSYFKPFCSIGFSSLSLPFT